MEQCPSDFIKCSSSRPSVFRGGHVTCKLVRTVHGVVHSSVVLSIKSNNILSNQRVRTVHAIIINCFVVFRFFCEENNDATSKVNKPRRVCTCLDLPANKPADQRLKKPNRARQINPVPTFLPQAARASPLFVICP